MRDVQANICFDGSDRMGAVTKDDPAKRWNRSTRSEPAIPSERNVV